MRQILSGFLATAMVVSMASVASFAVTAPSFVFTPVDVSVTPSFTLSDTGSSFESASTNTIGVEVTIDSITFDVEKSGSSIGNFTIPVNSTTFKGTSTVSAATATSGSAVVVVPAASVRQALVGKTFSSVQINGKLYSGKIVADGSNDVKVQFNESATIDFDKVVMTLNASDQYNTGNLKIKDSGGNLLTVNTITGAVTGGVPANTTTSIVTGDGKEIADVEKNGTFFDSYRLQDVVITNGNGLPVAMTEKNAGADKELNGEQGVQSGKTLYFMINDEVEKTFADDTYWKLKITKGDNAKLIKKVTDTTKIFTKGLYNAYDASAITGIDWSQRHRFIKVELNELYTDDEYKCTLDLRLSPTSKAQNTFKNVDDAEIKVKDFYFYVKNIVKSADNDWKVGIGGLMLNPLSNDWNEVTYFDEDGDLAFMKFFADSDVSKFYAKLSTKWEHADYASYFNDQDAYIFDFVGSPKLSATSRADLQIYNPFVNADGDEAIDPSTAVIYQVIDGDLFDVTDSFKYEEGDNGDMAFTTRTRFLGTYIICEKAVEEAVDNNEVPDELTPDTDVTPDEVTPDNNGGGKAPANTGKYL